MRVDPHADEVAKLAARLEREHPIRLEMLAVVTLAALAGFVVSFALLHVGLTNMAVRYAIATIGGYGVFAVSVRIWLLGSEASSNLRSDGHTSGGLNLNVFGWSGGKSSSSAGESLFKGGRSGGGGASAIFDAPQTGTMQTLAMTTPPPQSTSSGFSGLGNMKIGGGGGKGKGVLPLIVIALIAIGIAVVARVVWQSPHLIAEMLVDGSIAGTAIRGAQLAHHHREIDVVEHTWVPALIVLVLMIAIGAAGQHIRPDAVSIGDLFR
jgi:hypothetical protein